MNDNFTKLIALGIVGGVAKALFARPRTVVRNVAGPVAETVKDIAADTAKAATDSIIRGV